MSAIPNRLDKMTLLSSRGVGLKSGKKRRVPNDLPLYSPDEVLKKIKGLPEQKFRAFAAFLYLSGARIREVLGHKEKGLKGFCPKQYRKVYEDGVELRVFREMWTLKRRGGKVLRRSIPVVVGREREFVRIVDDWMDSRDPSVPAFGFSRQYGWLIIREMGMFPHFLRHLRNTHLVTEYGYNSSLLKNFNGWSDEKPASVYVHLGFDDLLRQMKK